MITPETQTYKRHMEIFGIHLPYTCVVYLNEEINKIGYTDFTKGMTTDAFRPWLAGIREGRS